MIILAVPAPPLPLLSLSAFTSPYRPAWQHQDNSHLCWLNISTMFIPVWLSPTSAISVARTMAVINDDAVFVSGGGTGSGGWVLHDITIIDGKKFGLIDPHIFACRAFCGNNFKMLHYMKALRNKKVLELIMSLVPEDVDPNDETPQIHNTVHIRKRQSIDRLPKFITIDVETTSVMVSVDVLPAWMVTANLQIEITESNLDLLLEEPPAAPAPFKPEIEQQDVIWIKSRNSVRCTYLGQFDFENEIQEPACGVV